MFHLVKLLQDLRCSVLAVYVICFPPFQFGEFHFSYIPGSLLHYCQRPVSPSEVLFTPVLVFLSWFNSFWASQGVFISLLASPTCSCMLSTFLTKASNILISYFKSPVWQFQHVCHIWVMIVAWGFISGFGPCSSAWPTFLKWTLCNIGPVEWFTWIYKTFRNDTKYPSPY